MNDSKRVIYAIFLAFFCLILGSWFVIRAGEILLVFIGTLFAASGATFFLSSFSRSKADSPTPTIDSVVLIGNVELSECPLPKMGHFQRALTQATLLAAAQASPCYTSAP
jgi:hypothetical protein